MAKSQKMWVYSPPKLTRAKLSDAVKSNISQQANEFIETVLKPQRIKPPPTDNQFNYVIDIYSKWYRHYFYIVSKYCCPSPHAISPEFEDAFARMRWVGEPHVLGIT